MLLYLLLLFLGANNCEGLSRIDPLVDTNVGLIRGIRAVDGEYSMFMGIPYGIVDVNNPFGPATSHPGFDNVFEAFDDSAICPQIEEFNNTIVGTLDCLHLNIYVPNSATSRNRLPVLVWIHGGGFSVGFSGRYLYGPKYLVRHDIILVTLNYRLGPYGFMCLNTPEISGNQGLKDQYMALKWIKNNINAFGGDANSITIFGESAGGASVDLHVHFDEERLFDKVIMQSGTSRGPWVIQEPDLSAPKKIANYLGYTTDDINDAVSFLSTVDTKLIIASASELNLSFRPCVEQDTSKRLISDYPINVAPKMKNIPVLIGYNDHEWLAQYLNKDTSFYKGLNNKFYEYLQSFFNFDDEQLSEMEKIVRQFYTGDEAIDEESMWHVVDFDSDIMFNYPTEISIKEYIDNGAETVFFYIFSYVGEKNFVKDRLNITVGGAVHADEIGYLFDLSYDTQIPSAEDQLMIDRITTLWANFVKYGNPTPDTSDLLPVQWTPVTKTTRPYLNINTDLDIQKRPFHKRIAFWDMFYKLNYEFQKGLRNDKQ
ncbi:bile salt-activated lipase [Bombyx mori]|uniref:Carboxylic ester hydrolase n=1 Tax=Bombyx mori TaxID=7091 RepID=A0A8R1WMJ4_BOMMO|nr:bile salt-activated lipase [Bombyx mori]